ncbi:MAG TPA: hypothetical protein VG722_01295, partial [Tepidisphaeraceae bacterium]|nr:hypothetical protein [Tepidisphaeraceae bacterium]
MYRWMQTNGKYLMAILGVMLMVAFTFPMYLFRDSRSDPVRGQMGKMDIHQSDLQRYRNEWDYLAHYAYVDQEVPSSEPGLPPERKMVPIVAELGQTAIQQIQQHPDMYPLLVEEARQMGVGVSKDRLETLLKYQVRTPDAEGKLIDPADSGDPNRVEYLQES